MAQAQTVEPTLSAPKMPDSGEPLPAGIDDKLDRLFGGGDEEQPQQQEPEAQQSEEAEATEESTDEAQPEFVEVEFSGTKYQVPPELKDALMYQADYTAKTTETARLKDTLAIQQKEVALFQEQRAFEQTVAEDFDRLKMLDAYIHHTKANTNWASLTTDQVVRAKLEIDQLVEQRGELANALQGKRQEFLAKLKGERDKLATSAKEVLSKAIPNWNDESRSSVESYVKSMGYPETAVPHMSALDYQVAWKAMQYDKLKAETKSAVKRAADAPVIAQTARKTPMSKQVRAKFDLKNAVKSGNREKIAAGIDARLDQMFGG